MTIIIIICFTDLELCNVIPCLHERNLSESRSGSRIFVPCKDSIWIILIQILGGLRCDNEQQCDALC